MRVRWVCGGDADGVLRGDDFCFRLVGGEGGDGVENLRLGGGGGGGQDFSHRMYLSIGTRRSTPQKIVNLLFTVTNQNIKLTILCGS